DRRDVFEDRDDEDEEKQQAHDLSAQPSQGAPAIRQLHQERHLSQTPPDGNVFFHGLAAFGGINEKPPVPDPASGQKQGRNPKSLKRKSAYDGGRRRPLQKDV